MDWQPRGGKCLGLSRQKERCTAPGLTTVTTGAVTASLLHTAPSSVLGLLLGPSSATDTNILQHGWRGKQLAAQQLFCPQSKASKSLPSPGSSKCSAPGKRCACECSCRQAGRQREDAKSRQKFLGRLFIILKGTNSN